MNYSDACAILGVHPTNTMEDIKTKYRNLITKYHPDVNNDADATTKAQEINQAYGYLKQNYRHENTATKNDKQRQNNHDDEFSQITQELNNLKKIKNTIKELHADYDYLKYMGLEGIEEFFSKLKNHYPEYFQSFATAYANEIINKYIISDVSWLYSTNSPMYIEFINKEINDLKSQYPTTFQAIMVMIAKEKESDVQNKSEQKKKK